MKLKSKQSQTQKFDRETFESRSNFVNVTNWTKTKIASAPVSGRRNETLVCALCQKQSAI